MATVIREIVSKDLLKTTIQAIDGEIGVLGDIYFDDSTWGIRYLVVDTSKWLPGRKVLIPPHALTSSEPIAQHVPLNLTKDQIRNSPDASSDQPVSLREEMELRAYYAWPPIAAASITPGPVIGSDYTFAALVPPPAVNAEEAEDHDPHLRSLSQELLGCQIETRDGEFGHIEDVTLDLRSGRLISIVIDTSRGRGGYKVVVPVSAITEIRLSGKVRLRAYREDIENAPLFFE